MGINIEIVGYKFDPMDFETGEQREPLVADVGV